ncbi:SDR family oxidoreductase, partial [Endothiovibrio diazotrophicus]
MNLQETRILLTGASGGIGQLTAEALAAKGAHLALVGRRAEALEPLCQRINAHGGEAHPVLADLSTADGAHSASVQAFARLGAIDLLINNAGTLQFTRYGEQDPETIERIVQTNLLGPMLLTRAILPHMEARNRGRIVNVGSTFGTLGFACFTAYSASKFGLRGFSEALRRELDGSAIGVTYIAPRAARTRINDGAVMAMADAVKMNMDPPERVAKEIVAAIEGDAKEHYIGFPESFFARLNALLPRLVDGALRKQNAILRRFAGGETAMNETEATAAPCRSD